MTHALHYTNNMYTCGGRVSVYNTHINFIKLVHYRHHRSDSGNQAKETKEVSLCRGSTHLTFANINRIHHIEMSGSQVLLNVAKVSIKASDKTIVATDCISCSSSETFRKS